MKKKSYRNKRLEERQKVKPEDLPSTPEAAKDAGNRGYSMPGEPANAIVTEHEEAPFFARQEDKKSHNLKEDDYDDLLNLLVSLSDEMDKQTDVSLANFSDFLIKKVAIQKSLDYSGLFKDLLIKIIESDIINKNEVLIEITREYNKLLKLYTNLDKNTSAVRREAYQGSVLKAKEYVE